MTIPPVADVQLSADSAVVPLGDSLTLTAIVRNAAGRVLDTLEAPRTWRSSLPTLLSVRGSAARGVYTATNVGSALAIVVVGPASDTLRVRVPTPVARVTPDSLALAVGDTASLTATLDVAPGVDRAAQRGVTWSVLDATIVRAVPASGVRTTVTALRTGTTVVRADVGGILRDVRVIVR